MLKAILENPYRVLGIYANAEDNDVMAATDKLLISPGAQCKTDYNIIGLPKPRRDAAAVSSARQKLMDVNDAAVYKLFWFMKSPDKAGENKLHSGDVSGASNDWFYSDTEESKHNIMVGYLVEGNFSCAAYEVYEKLINQDYRIEHLKTKLSYNDLVERFKALLFDDSNSASVPIGVGLSWKRYVQDNILTGISSTILGNFLSRAKKQIDFGVVKSYLAALSTMYQAFTYFRAVIEFADHSDNRYLSMMKEVTNYVQSWIETYLSGSSDIFKYRNVQSYATAFSLFSHDVIQATYLKLLGWNLQKAGELLLLPDSCNKYNSLAKEIYSFYKSGRLSSDSYRTLIERLAPGFVELKKTQNQGDGCYQQLSNYLAKVGLLIIRKELSMPLTEQIVADGGSVICYIDRIIENKYLYDPIKAERNACMNQLWALGLGPVDNPRFPNSMRLMRWDESIFLDEDTTYQSYCTSLKGCQNYIKRFPNGRYVSEVKELIAKNDFKIPVTKTHNSTASLNTASHFDRPVAPKPNLSAVNSPANASNKKETRPSTNKKKPITISSALIFIGITLAIEALCWLIFGKFVPFIVGLLTVAVYWLHLLRKKLPIEQRAKSILAVYIALQSIASIVALIIFSSEPVSDKSMMSFIHCSLLLGISLLVMCISMVISNYIDDNPGESRKPDGKSPLFLGTGNGIGARMVGDFYRKPIDGHLVNVNYVFISILVPIIPVGCYDASMTSYSSKSHKKSTTTYAISGSQPWRFIEILQIYCWWYSFFGIAIGIIGVIASLCGENFL